MNLQDVVQLYTQSDSTIRTAVFKAQAVTPIDPMQLSEEQLCQILADRRLLGEADELSNTVSDLSINNTIQAGNATSKAVGSALFADLTIEGVVDHHF